MVISPLYPLAFALTALPVSSYQPGPTERLQQQFETYYLQTVPDAADAIEARLAEMARQSRDHLARQQLETDGLTSISAPSR